MSSSILLVEPNSEQRQLFLEYLSHHLPHKSMTAVASSTDAWSHWPTAALVVTANLLYPFSGVELIKLIRAQDRLTPILMYSSDYAARHDAMAAGATRFLDKGPLLALLTNVRELLDVASVNNSVTVARFRIGP